MEFELLHRIGINVACHNDETKTRMLAQINSDPFVAPHLTHGKTVADIVGAMTFVQRSFLRERVLNSGKS